jgi:hypothetical protein
MSIKRIFEKGTIIIITINKDIFSNPSIIYFLRNISINKKVIILSHSKQDFHPPDDLLHIQIFNYPLYFGSNFLKIFDVYKNIFKILKLLNKSNTILAIDPDGLIQACKWKFLSLNKSKIVYWSFEIVIYEELISKSAQFKKKIEIICSKLITLIIVQDTARKKLLFDENKILSNKETVLIPVAPLKFTNNVVINNTKKTILFSGSVAAWTGIDNLLLCLDAFRDYNFRLHIHSRYILNHDDPIYIKVKELEGKGILTYSDEYFVEEEKYLEFISRFDLGLVYYKPIFKGGGLGKNISNIGLSSGKFSSYLACGKPVIASFDPTYLDLRKTYMYGEIYDDFKQIPELMKKIIYNYDDYVDEVYRLYENELNPVNKFMFFE